MQQIQVVNVNMKEKKTTRSRFNRGIVNVLGQTENDPICDFENCYHRFSVHGKRSHILEYNCKCNHPTNAAAGAKRR